MAEKPQEMIDGEEDNSSRPHRTVAVVNGPVLNFLGIREPSIYGSVDLKGIEKRVEEKARELNIRVEFFQSNHEGEILDYLQSAVGRISGLILNPGGLTHTSVCLRDALLTIDVPFIEVHITNIYSREAFRAKSLISDIANGFVGGFGWFGYILALEGLAERLGREN